MPDGLATYRSAQLCSKTHPLAGVSCYIAIEFILKGVLLVYTVPGKGSCIARIPKIPAPRGWSLKYKNTC